MSVRAAGVAVHGLLMTAGLGSRVEAIGCQGMQQLCGLQRSSRKLYAMSSCNWECVLRCVLIADALSVVLAVVSRLAGTSPQLCWCQRCAQWATLSLAMTCRPRLVAVLRSAVVLAAGRLGAGSAGQLHFQETGGSSWPATDSRWLGVEAPHTTQRADTPVCALLSVPSSMQVVINCGALNCLLNLLTANHKKSIKKEACWTISNITAGTKEQIQAVIDSQLVSPLVHLLGVSAAHLASCVWTRRAAARNAQ